MREALDNLNSEQINFICEECSLSKDILFSLSEDDLYDKVYDVMCDIEISEAPEGNEPESERCIIASDIVTELGNSIAEEQGFLDEEEDEN